MQAAVGYYKVVTTDERVARDPETHRGPLRPLHVPPDAYRASALQDERRTTQWIYTFTRDTHDAVRARAFAKAERVLEQIGSGRIHLQEMEQIDTYAIRVG